MRGQIKREVSEQEFNDALKANPDIELENGIYVRRIKMVGLVWNQPVAAKIGDKFYVMRPA
jgi:hypothetical protein